MDIVEEMRSDPEKGAKRLDAEFRIGLTTLAMRFCTDASDAEDLVNRTFAEACRSIDRYAEQSAFFAWISKIMTNIHANDVRRKSRQNEVLDGERHESEPDPDAEAAIYRDVDASILRDAIDRLPPDERNAVVMHYFLDIPVREAARILSVPSGTFAWRLHNARMILAAKLGAFVKKPGAKAIMLLLAAALILAASAAVVAVLGIESGELRPHSHSHSHSQFSSTSQGEQKMRINTVAASAAIATLILSPVRASSDMGASSAEASFKTFNSACGNSGGFAPEAFLSRCRTSDDSNVLSSFNSRKPVGFTINIR